MRISKRNMKTKMITFMLSIGLLFAVIGCTSTPADNDDTIDTIEVTGITIQGAGSATTITTHAGALQLSATITPTNASNKSVTWSVTNGTGEATISTSGLLTAVADGTVTAKVVSVAKPSLSAEIVITVSNQVTDNTAPLATLIVEATQNKNDTPVGLNASAFVSSVTWVLSEDQAAYADAIEDAQTVLDAAPLTDTEVTNAVAALNAATVTFNESKQNGTKTIQNINLGTAADFVILSKTGVSTTGTTAVTGNIGISPADATYITGFGLIMDSGNTFSTSSLVTGQIFAADYAVATPAYLTTAIADVMIAYNDGSGRSADYTELYTGDLSGKTLQTGVYMWSNDVLINTDLTLNGTATDVMIFQIASTLTVAANVQITLTGGLLAENIYWVVADTVAIGTGSAFQGVILAMTNVSMNTGSTLVGMIYAQTSVSLDASVVTKP